MNQSKFLHECCGDVRVCLRNLFGHSLGKYLLKEDGRKLGWCTGYCLSTREKQFGTQVTTEEYT